ncbi:MAG: MATE family efflux transporter [Flavobacteriaceae bacterium]|jgi:putative MATE family efflux protein|nr:MATE family efflux transporter [Flavobacteriaceae bacterium]HCZ10624.1 MATE family efflux transporter [Flavobacteriaceae bacterium]
MKSGSATFGTQPIPQLLIKQAVPAAVGILVMSLNVLIDTIFVGQWIGANAIAAINVVLPVSFFIAALGMAIGLGGGSIISRALGKDNLAKATKTFGNQIVLNFSLTISFALVGLLFMDSIIPAFGGKGALFEPAKIYYTIVLYGVPILGFCMMGNNVIRAVGKPKYAMYAMMLPSISNLILDYVLIYIFDFGMYGAAWATTLSYGVCGIYILYFFTSKNAELKPLLSDFKIDWSITKEIGALGSVTLARQAVVSISVLLVNNLLYRLDGESAVAVYAIISRLLMFSLFPILGITQGFIPIAGYNYGAKNKKRVEQVIRTAVLYSSGLATLVFMMIYAFSNSIGTIFTSEPLVLQKTPAAIRWVFAATPIVGIQLIGAAYYQAIGKALPALLLTLTRQGFFFIPLLYILPEFLGIDGVWIAFPIAELLAAIVTGGFLIYELKKYLNS